MKAGRYAAYGGGSIKETWYLPGKKLVSNSRNRNAWTAISRAGGRPLVPVPALPAGGH